MTDLLDLRLPIAYAKKLGWFLSARLIAFFCTPTPYREQALQKSGDSARLPGYGDGGLHFLRFDIRQQVQRAGHARRPQSAIRFDACVPR